MQSVFDGIYSSGEWGAGSGPGSARSAMAAYKSFVQRMITQYRPESVLDLGCGYFAPYADMDWPDYTGFDVATAPIEANKRDYGSPSRRFEQRDWMEGELPQADLVLIKDVLQHWPDELVRRGLQRLSACKRVIITNSVILGQNPVNTNIELGGCRPLNLLLPPFGLARPADFRMFDAPENREIDYKLALVFRGEELR